MLGADFYMDDVGDPNLTWACNWRGFISGPLCPSVQMCGRSSALTIRRYPWWSRCGRDNWVLPLTTILEALVAFHTENKQMHRAKKRCVLESNEVAIAIG